MAPGSRHVTIQLIGIIKIILSIKPWKSQAANTNPKQITMTETQISKPEERPSNIN